MGRGDDVLTAETLQRPPSGDAGIRQGAAWSVVVTRLRHVYGGHANVESLLDRVSRSLATALATRPQDLAQLDAERRADPDWISASGQAVYTFYTDRFAGSLKGLASRTAYLKDLGVRWVHPLPLLKPRPGDSDGGFAVADYRQVDPALGTMEDLSALATTMRQEGIGLLLDIVSNHTAREHAWAQKAREGDLRYRDYYIVLNDEREVADREKDLIDVFPDTAPGNFTWDAEMGGHVWTTFYPFQWDLNYANPEVFLEMLEVLLYLANQGVQGFRLDSAPFLWKREGTTSRNQPEAYALVEAWRAALDIAAPSVVLLAEAIESLDDVLPFFGSDQPGCDLAYNNGVMTALWGGLADGDATIVRRVMTAALAKPKTGAWLNYVRCHDDLIWNALAAYAPQDDLQRWSNIYGGVLPGFSEGRAFQTAAGGAPSTNGMTASLTGLGRDPAPTGEAAARIRLLYGVIHALDGWPLIYMGDEIGLGDDRDYECDPMRRADGRWLHRPMMDWNLAEDRGVPGTLAGSLFSDFKRFGERARALNEEGVGGPAEPFDAGEPSVLAFRRIEGRRVMTVYANLAARPVVVRQTAGSKVLRDVLTGGIFDGPEVALAGYDLVWLVSDQ